MGDYKSKTAEKQAYENLQDGKRSIFSEGRWFQVSAQKEVIYALSWLFQKGIAATLFITLLAKADYKNEVKISKNKELFDALGMCEQSFYRTIKVLIDNNFIATLKEKNATVYIINPQIAWKSWGKNIDKCRFPKGLSLPEPPKGSPAAKEIAKYRRQRTIRKNAREAIEALKKEAKIAKENVSYEERYAGVPLPPYEDDHHPVPAPKEKKEKKEHITEDEIRRVKEAADIVKVVEKYVPLKRVGTNFLGICPYHNEITPSFCVSPSRQIFKCFGCDESGDVFKFVMDMEHLDFIGAVKLLADTFNVILEVD